MFFCERQIKDKVNRPSKPVSIPLELIDKNTASERYHSVIVNDDQQDATILAYLFIYLFIYS
jgi:hypothetical protein